MPRSAATTQGRPALLAGLLAMGVVIAVWGFGGLRPATLIGQNLLFRHASTMPADDRIAVIAIDDAAIEHGPAWPWPRRTYAELIDILREVGSGPIVLDITFTEPTAPRAELPQFERHHGVEPDPEVLGDLIEIIHDDDELAAAMRRGGGVYLAMICPLAGDEPAAGDARLDEALTFDITLSEEDAARLLGRSLAPGELTHARQAAARAAARKFFDERPGAAAEALLAIKLPADSVNRHGPARDDLLVAYRRELAWRALRQNALPPPPRQAGVDLPQATDVLPPIDKLAMAAAGVGHATHVRDASDGSARGVPPVVVVDGRLVLSLGLLAGLQAEGRAVAETAIEGGDLVLIDGEQRLHIPLDADGLMPIRWHVPSGRAWWDSFAVVPAGRVLEIAANREAITRNAALNGLARARLVERRHAETPAAYADYAKVVRTRNDLRRSLPLATSEASAQRIAAQLVTHDESIAAAEYEALEWLAYQQSIWADAEAAAGEAEEAQRREIVALAREHLPGGEIDQRITLNTGLAERNMALMAELRPQLAGRVCFLGYTATALADFVTSPVYSSLPGVMAHANVANMVLTGQFLRPASGYADLLLLTAAGWLAAWLTTRTGPRISAVLLALVCAAALAAAAMLFRAGGAQLDWPAACACAAAAWAGVTLYRQFVEERARRSFERALAHYTSPAVAARIAARAGPEDFAPVAAQVTCFFCDLKGFTALSETLGPLRTQRVLNEYFGGVTRALVAHGAIVNKFMGDGVFAFFNAPIHPCAEPASAACAAALAAVEVVRRINRDAARLALPEELVIRVGLSSGEAFVGDFGSTAKLDYTCIGDVVNLGSRLEGACRRLGTTILVDEVVRRSAGEDFLFRSLGRLRIEGLSTIVSVAELVAADEAADLQQRRVAEWFDRAMEHFEHARWKECVEMLTACLAARPEDEPARLLKARAERHAADPPDAPFDPVFDIRGGK
jgi:class 3 adenylate cyclase/CHASE2 domain-containing sensor protein